MFLYFSHCFSKNNLLFKLFNNLIFRSIGSLFTSLIILLIFCPFFIKKLKMLQLYQKIRLYNPITHLSKKNVPTMGGVLIIFTIFFSMLLWNNLSIMYVWYCIYILISYGIIGYIDDFIKIKNRQSNGLSIKWKYFWLSIFSLIIVVIIYILDNNNNCTKLVVPFLQNTYLNIGILYLLLSYFTIVSSSNAVNLTDGLDGLVVVPIILISISLIIISEFSCNMYYIQYFNTFYLKDSNEIIIICMSIIGSNIGFLWFNSHPAQIFMGDTGSLALGGIIGLISVLLHQELLLLFTGSIFILETISVIIQIFSVKIFKKKFFLMAPIHHHFELSGYLEPKIVVRFWIISLISVLFGLITLINYV